MMFLCHLFVERIYLFHRREVLREFVCTGPLWMASEVLRNLVEIVPLFKNLYGDRD